jgi:hypothetical protein
MFAGRSVVSKRIALDISRRRWGHPLKTRRDVTVTPLPDVTGSTPNNALLLTASFGIYPSQMTMTLSITEASEICEQMCFYTPYASLSS